MPLSRKKVPHCIFFLKERFLEKEKKENRGSFETANFPPFRSLAIRYSIWWTNAGAEIKCLASIFFMPTKLIRIFRCHSRIPGQAKAGRAKEVIHKIRRHFFVFFDTPFWPPCRHFLLLSVDILPTSFMDGPKVKGSSGSCNKAMYH